MSDLKTLLPPNAHPALKAVEAVMAERTRGMEKPIRSLWDVDTCPAALLPWLAWTFSVEIWDHRWTDAAKRNVIRDAVRVHRLKGTRKSVELALQGLGFRVDLVEGWEEGGAPHTFRLDAYGEDIFAAGLSINSQLMQTVNRLIENVKPVRSHFTFRIGETFARNVTAKSGVRHSRRQTGALSPVPDAHECEATALGMQGQRLTARHSAILRPTPEAAETEMRLGLFAGVAFRQIARAVFSPKPKPGALYAN